MSVQKSPVTPTRRIPSYLTAALAALSVALPAAAFAQSDAAADEAAEAPAPSTQAQRRGTVEEIVVTARKTEERLIDTPISISAFGAVELQERGVNDLFDISVATPGFQFEKLGNRYGAQNGGTRPVIRGMSSIGSESNVAFFVDGILYSNNMMSFPMDIVERVEVIKGPQSALFGRSTFAGAINYITKKPTNEVQNEISARIAQYNDYEVNLMSRGPLVRDKWYYMAHARYYDFGGEHVNEFDGEKVGQENSVGVNGSIEYRGDRLRATLSAGYNEDDDGLAATGLQDRFHNNCFLDSFRQYYCGDIKPKDTINVDRSALKGLEGLRRETTRLMLGFEYDFGPFMLVSNSGFFDTQDEYGYDSDYIDAGRAGTNLRLEVRDRREWSTELRLQSQQSQRLRWLAGIFYYDRDLQAAQERRHFSNLSDLDLGLTTVENKAIFGALTYDITSRLTGSVELRYAEDDLSFRDDSGRTYATKNDNVTPRFTLDYKLTDDTMLYGVVAKGNKPGGVNSNPELPPDRIGVDEEENWSYEIGTKNTLFEGRMTMNLAAFFIDWKDQQLTDTYVTPAGNSVSYSINVGKTEIKGLEYVMDLALSENLYAGMTYAYIDSRFKLFNDNEGAALFGDPSMAGRRTPNTAKNEMTLYTRYNLTFANGWTGFIRADYAYNEGKYAQAYNLASTGDRRILNLRFGVNVSENLDLSLYVRNVTDDDTPSSVIRYIDNKNTLPSIPPGSGLVNRALRGFNYPLADGRRIGLTVRYRF